MSEEAQLPVEEDETFCEVTCLFPDTGALGCFESSPSASKRASGSGFASGWAYLRFNIGGPAKLKIGTSMPKLAQLAGFNS